MEFISNNSKIMWLISNKIVLQLNNDFLLYSIPHDSTSIFCFKKLVIHPSLHFTHYVGLSWNLKLEWRTTTIIFIFLHFHFWSSNNLAQGYKPSFSQLSPSRHSLLLLYISHLMTVHLWTCIASLYQNLIPACK